MKSTQKELSQTQIKAFYHDQFVDSQVRDYMTLVSNIIERPRAVVDVGGGCGFFAQALKDAAKLNVRVIDMDPLSVDACTSKGVVGVLGDALSPERQGDEDVVCFNLILHHLVGASENQTLVMQKEALVKWHGQARVIFVNEYIYESYVGNISGRIIYAITRSKLLSVIGKAISVFVPSLRANTFDVGVRFRAHDEWCRIFQSAGFRVIATRQGKEDGVSLARRLLMIKNCRRDSFLLEPVHDVSWQDIP